MPVWITGAVCILVVEDEWLIRTMLAEELTYRGFEVREAEDGEQASALIAQYSAAFTLLVTDIHMPGTLDGVGVAQLMRQRRPDLPVIYATGRPDALNALQPLGAKEALLQKPYAIFDMLAAVRRLLGQGG
jgi:DNA-binding response OmpR family regulator